MKFKIATLGCKVNHYESEAIQSMLEQSGFLQAEENENADVVIVNSCTVTAESDRKVRQLLRRMQRDNPSAISVLTGCMPQAFPEEAAEKLNADIILGTKRRSALPKHINRFVAHHERIIDISDHESGEKFENMQISAFGERTRAFVKIQDGCNRFCSYCIIPYARGRVRSKPISEIEAELKALAQNGYNEVVLTGINLPSYGQDIGGSLIDAIEAAAKIDGITRIRLGSLEPERLDDSEIKRMSQVKKLCPQFHLSLQSGCDATLKRMNRHYTTEDYRKIVTSLRRSFENAAITTDLMVGFAGETDEEFQDSYDFCNDIGFAKMHVFAYSRRPGTAAYDMPNQLTNSIKSKRSHKMIELAEQMQQSFFNDQLGKTESVLFEQEIAPNIYEGYSMNYTPVRVSSITDISGRIFDVEITEAKSDYCVGHLK